MFVEGAVCERARPGVPSECRARRQLRPIPLRLFSPRGAPLSHLSIRLLPATPRVRLAPQVKAPDAPGSGFGGDWAVRVEASRRPADDAGAGGARQISVLFYVIDGRLAGGADMQAAPAGRGKRLGDVSAVILIGRCP